MVGFVALQIRWRYMQGALDPSDSEIRIVFID